MKVKSESEVAQSYLTLSDRMDCSLTGSSVHGVFQARVLEWGAIAIWCMLIFKGQGILVLGETLRVTSSSLSSFHDPSRLPPF